MFPHHCLPSFCCILFDTDMFDWTDHIVIVTQRLAFIFLTLVLLDEWRGGNVAFGQWGIKNCAKICAFASHGHLAHPIYWEQNWQTIIAVCSGQRSICRF